MVNQSPILNVALEKNLDSVTSLTDFKAKKTHLTSKISAGIVSIGDSIIHPLSHDAMMRLRGRRYLTKGFLHEDEIDIDECSIREKPDIHDVDSIGFAVVKGTLEDPEPVAIACFRLILKQHEARLPVEKHFDIPEIEPQKAVEISRFINDPNQYPDITILLMISSAIGLMLKLKREGYGVLERPLVRLASSFGVDFQSLSDAKILDQYGPKPNLAVRISPGKSIYNMYTSGEIKKRQFARLCIQASRAIDDEYSNKVIETVRG